MTQQNPDDVRLVVLPEREPFWNHADLGFNIEALEPVVMLEALEAMIDSGEAPDLAELPIDVAYALGLERPDAFIEIPATMDLTREDGLHPFMFQGRFVGFDMDNNRVLLPLEPNRWPLDPDMMERLLEIIRRLYCVSNVVAVSGTGSTGQQQSQFDDSADDFLLRHPLFEVEFDIPPFDPEDPLLRGLDILSAEYIPNGEFAQFTVTMANEEALAQMPEIPQAIQVGLLLDVNTDGASDYIVVTTNAEEALLLTNSYEFVSAVTLHIDGNRAMLDVPALRLGERFEWTVYTGYSPNPDAFYMATNAEFLVVEVPVVPIVDVAFALPSQRTYQIHQSQQQTQQGQQQGQLNQTIIFYCPSGSSGTTLLWEQSCPDRTIRLSCINGAFGRWISNRSVNPPSEGYMARCPYSGGINQYEVLRGSFPNVPEEVYHSVKNPASQDVMHHKYVFSTDELFSYHESPNGIVTNCQPNPWKLHQNLWEVPPDATCGY